MRSIKQNGLKVETLEYLLECARKYNVKALWLFGSCLQKAENEAHDIDIGVEGLDEGWAWKMRSELCEHFDKIIDFVEMDTPLYIVPFIRRDGILLHKASDYIEMPVIFSERKQIEIELSQMKDKVDALQRLTAGAKFTLEEAMATNGYLKYITLSIKNVLRTLLLASHAPLKNGNYLRQACNTGVISSEILEELQKLFEYCRSYEEGEIITEEEIKILALESIETLRKFLNHMTAPKTEAREIVNV
jgi:predicted nucleotidyltransferase